MSASLDDLNNVNDPDHWRERAKEARAKAEQVTDPVAKTSMLEAAQHYERLADQAESRQRDEH